MKVTDMSAYRLMQSNLDRITNNLQDLRHQGTTGLKLNTSSDDPGAIRPVMNTRSQLSEADRYLETMGQTADKMAATDGYLDQVENVMVRAKELAINSANGAMSSTDLHTLADEIAILKDELLSISNATIDGKHIFAGYQQSTQPFTDNPSYDPDLYDIDDVATWPVLYSGDHNPTRLEITPGEFVEANVTGNELFMGITNEIAATGYATPYQGQSVSSSSLTPGPFGDDFTITPGSGPAITISGAAFVDGALETNYIGNVVLPEFNQTGTGLVATANAATKNLGALALTGFDETESDTYSLDIVSGGTTVSVTLDGATNNFDYTLEGLASALANSTPTPTNLTSTSGTLTNGVNYDISTGSLVLTGPVDGSEIELTETTVDNGVAGTSGGITGGSQTVYGTINIATNSSDDVVLAGAPGLANLGLSSNTLNGASGNIDLFTILTRLEESVRAGNIDDPSGAGGGVNAQIANLELGADQNRTYRATLGAKASRVDTAMEHQEDAKIDLQQILSRYQDADVLEVYNEIIQQESAFKAALNIAARISEITILDYF